MKRLLLYLFLTGLIVNSQAQDLPEDSIWVYKGFFSQQLNQSSFSNWAAGGQNSLSSTSLLNIEANYNRDKITWENRLEMAYGIIKTENVSIRKNEDRIDMLSRLGRSLNEKMMVSAQLNFLSQFDEGFDYPNDSVIVSKFMAPAYLVVALGMDYRPFKDFSIFLSPATGKFTFVMDDELSAQGAFGVDEGENLKAEFGAMLSLMFSRSVMENVLVSSKINLFNAYDSYVDVNWEGSINMKINKFLTTSLLFQLIYDHDIPIPIYGTVDGQQVQVGEGPRTQFKQLLGVGFSYNF